MIATDLNLARSSVYIAQAKLHVLAVYPQATLLVEAIYVPAIEVLPSCHRHICVSCLVSSVLWLTSVCCDLSGSL